MHNFHAIRTYTHKFIENYNDRNELYDLVADPDEMYNVVDEQADLVQELRQMMKERMKERMKAGKWLR